MKERQDIVLIDELCICVVVPFIPLPVEFVVFEVDMMEVIPELVAEDDDVVVEEAPEDVEDILVEDMVVDTEGELVVVLTDGAVVEVWAEAVVEAPELVNG